MTHTHTWIASPSPKYAECETCGALLDLELTKAQAAWVNLKWAVLNALGIPKFVEWLNRRLTRSKG